MKLSTLLSEDPNMHLKTGRVIMCKKVYNWKGNQIARYQITYVIYKIMYFFIPHSSISRKRPNKSHTDYIVDITLELMDSLS